MQHERKHKRLYPKEFQDYSVFLEFDEITISASLANVSETGLCLITDEDIEFSESETTESPVLEGCILYKIGKERIEFQGKIAWQNEVEPNSKQKAYGVSFETPIQLTDSLLYRSMAIE